MSKEQTQLIFNSVNLENHIWTSLKNRLKILIENNTKSGVTKSIDTKTCISASLKAGLCQWVNLQKDLRLWLRCGCCSKTCYTDWELSSISHFKFVYGEWIPSCSSSNTIPSTTIAAEEFSIYAMSPVPAAHTESNTVLFQPLQYLGQNYMGFQCKTPHLYWIFTPKLFSRHCTSALLQHDNHDSINSSGKQR